MQSLELRYVEVGIGSVSSVIRKVAEKVGATIGTKAEVDAFTDKAFKGNPAAVCLLEETKDEEWLQSVAAEFNISETCYLTPIAASDAPRFGLRWFTTVAEVDLCGHATLAASHFLFSYGLVKSDKIEFSTLSGILTAKKITEDGREDFLIELDFPVVPVSKFSNADILKMSEYLNGASVVEVQKTAASEDLLVVLPSGKVVAEVEPNIEEIRKCPGRGVIITGPALPESGFDFISRFFCPKFGINEDPVCGSAHCALADYWSKRLGKSDFVAYQASPRGGVINLHLDEKNHRVFLRGKAVVVTEGFVLV